MAELTREIFRKEVLAPRPLGLGWSERKLGHWINSGALRVARTRYGSHYWLVSDFDEADELVQLGLDIKSRLGIKGKPSLRLLVQLARREVLV